MVSQRIEDLRDRLQRRRRAAEGRRRDADRRVRRNEPEGVAETTRATARQLRMLGGEIVEPARSAAGEARDVGETVEGVGLTLDEEFGFAPVGEGQEDERTPYFGDAARGGGDGGFDYGLEPGADSDTGLSFGMGMGEESDRDGGLSFL